tara:strand:+ start:673 stop:1521 length:849 start_codon:yes stop_codon:yes gene_type:complete
MFTQLCGISNDNLWDTNKAVLTAVGIGIGGSSSLNTMTSPIGNNAPWVQDFTLQVWSDFLGSPNEPRKQIVLLDQNLNKRYQFQYTGDSLSDQEVLILIESINQLIEEFSPEDLGCTDIYGLNYNSLATVDNNTCEYADYVVEAGGFYYSPENLIIEVGESVQWNNLEGYHDVLGLTGPEVLYLPPTMGPSLIGSYTFTEPGVYDYECSIGDHAILGMVGSITVNDIQIGDLNNDTIVNVIDIIILVNSILNNNDFNIDLDINADGVINILDIIELANIIIE